MELKNFDALVSRVQGRTQKKRMAVAVAADVHTIEAALHARREGIAHPILVGDSDEICRILQQLGETIPQEDIVHQPEDGAACRQAVALVREGHADFLMKGKVDTAVILKAVVDKTHGLNRGGVISHVAMMEVPSYHKLLIPVDGGMIPHPTLEQKRAILENTVGALHAMGYRCPKVGVITCTEKVNPKMPETLDGQALQQMNQRGEITECTVVGPISYDCAVSRTIAQAKGYHNPIAGDVDVLLVPDIHTGNILGKALLCSAGAKMAGFVVGASCPIVLASRGSSAEEKFLSIAASAAAVIEHEEVKV